MQIIENQCDSFTGPRIDAGREGRRRGAVKLEADCLSDDPSDLGEAAVGRYLELVGRAPRNRRRPRSELLQSCGLSRPGRGNDERQAIRPQLVDQRVDALARKGST